MPDGRSVNNQFKGRGVATKFLLGVGFIGTQIHLPQKFSFCSDFGHFIKKNVRKCKIVYVSRKNILKNPNSGGSTPLFSKVRGLRPRDPPPPPPPVGDAPVQRYVSQYRKKVAI